MKDYLRLRAAACADPVLYLSDRDEFESLEQLYLSVRAREGRLYTDDVLRRLPDVEKTHALYREWQIRGKSCRRLKAYWMQRPAPAGAPARAVLDLGCGNGWMANQLAQLPGCEIFAMDVNRLELEQAARVFSGNDRLTFLYGNIFKDVLPPESFDLIVLASSIQYFSDLSALLPRLGTLLRARGEIHVLDSPFYHPDGAAQAARRTEEYYRNMGMPDMARRYHHHTYEKLHDFRPVFLYRPDTPFRRAARKIFARADSPFPWIKIEKSALTGGKTHEKKSTLS